MTPREEATEAAVLRRLQRLRGRYDDPDVEGLTITVNFGPGRARPRKVTTTLRFEEDGGDRGADTPRPGRVATFGPEAGRP